MTSKNCSPRSVSEVQRESNFAQFSGNSYVEGSSYQIGALSSSRDVNLQGRSDLLGDRSFVGSSRDVNFNLSQYHTCSNNTSVPDMCAPQSVHGAIISAKFSQTR